MPPIVVKAPGEGERLFRFPENTDPGDIRIFLGTKHAEDFPLLAEDIVQERGRAIELGGQLQRLKKTPLRADSVLFKTFDTVAGATRGLIGAVMNLDVAEEEFGPEFRMFAEGRIPGSAEAPDPQIAIQQQFGDITVPFTDIRIFPSAPALVDPQTGAFENGSAYRPANFEGAMRAGLRRSALGQIGVAATNALMPADRFGEEFEEFVADGQLERTAMALSEIFGRLPEFYVGGRIGVGLTGRTGARFGAGATTQQALNRYGSLVGAFGFSNFIDTVVRDQIELGTPKDLSQAVDRVADALLEGGKGGITGLALSAGQSVGVGLFGRAFGVPAGSLPGSSLRAMAADAGGKFVGGTAAFGTVPPLLEGEAPSVEGYVDAAAIMAAFGLGEMALVREIARNPEGAAADHVKAVLVETGEFLLPPPPVSGPRTTLTPKTLYIEGPRERLMLEPGEVTQALPGAEPARRLEPPPPGFEPARQLPAPEPGTIAEGPGFVMEGRQPGQIAPAEAPVRRPAVPTAFEEQVVGRNEQALRRLEEQQQAFDLESGLREIEQRQGLDPSRLLPAPDIDFTLPRTELRAEPTRAIGPVRRAAFFDEQRVDALTGRRVTVEAEFRRVLPSTKITDQLRGFREFQTKEDLARKPGPEEQVLEPQEVDAAPAIQEARTKAGSSQEALESLVSDLAIIEAKASPEAVQEATARASELSGAAVELRRAEARNLARQIAENDYFAPGESIVDVIGASQDAQSLRIRVRNNDGVQDTLDIPIQEGPIAGVREFVEADRRARASIETAIAGRTAEAEQSGLMGRIRDRLFSELERLKADETGAILNPFGRKRPTPKTEADEYLPPDIEQVSRHRLMGRLTQINQQLDMLEMALRRPELKTKERQTIERRIALKREEQIIFGRAANVAPFTVQNAREELERRNFNDLRAVARQMRIQLSKHPKKAEIIDKIIARRDEVKGQIRSHETENELALRGIREFNAERSAGVRRFTNARERAEDAVLRQVSATHTILRDVRALKAEHPESAEIFDAAIREAELIRGGGPAGTHIAHRVTKEVFGGLSRSEKDLLDKMARFRADIALNDFDPLVKGTIDSVTANATLKNLQGQDRETFQKISQRVDKLRDIYQEALEFAVDEGLVAREAADRMLAIGEYLPTRYAELIDPAAVGISGRPTAKASPLRRRGEGFQIEDFVDLEGVSTPELANTLRKLKVRGDISELTREQLITRIEEAARQRSARITDTQFLTTDYFTGLYGNVFRNRAAKAIAEIATELPDNGIVRHAETFRDPEGRLQFRQPEGTEQILQYRIEGETRGIVVDKPFADAFDLTTQRTGMEQFLPFVGIMTGARITKLFATGAAAPGFAIVALPRDYFHMRISTDVLGHMTYKSWLPGLGEARIGKDLSAALPDVVVRGPLTRQYLENGGAMDFLAQASLFQKGEKPTDALRAGIVDLQMAETNSMLLRGLQNVSFEGAKAARFAYKAMQYTNTTAELVSRVAEMNRRKAQIAKEKGISVDELSDSDIRTAVLAARSRIDFADGGNMLRFAEEFLPYTRASIQALRGPGRTLREEPGQAAMLAGVLLTFPMMMYAINRHNNEQGLKDLPSYARGDIVYVLPESIGTFTDEATGNTRQAYIRLPVDQSLYLFNTIGYNLAALALGDPQNVDPDAITAAATRILTLPDTSNIPLTMKLMLEPLTNRSTTFKGMVLYRGAEGGVPGAEVEAESTSPAMIRLGELYPGLSPERMQESLESAIPDSFGARGIAKIANKVSGIEDVRPEETKMFLQRIPGVDRILKDFALGRNAISDGEEIATRAIAADNIAKASIQRNLLAARKRNDGRLTEESGELDRVLAAEIGAISSEQQKELVRGILERLVDFEAVNATSIRPNVWRTILTEEPPLAATRYYAGLQTLTEPNREIFAGELAALRRSRAKLKSKTWWKEFNVQLRALAPEWDDLVKAGRERDFQDIAIDFLQQQGEIGRVPTEFPQSLVTPSAVTQ